MSKVEKKDSINAQMKILHETMNRVIVIMNDLSGGMIKLGEVCNVNVQCRLDNFEVKSFK